ncbi:MAG TPA: ATP-binding protein [Chthoniobacteraceae bacterium]|jgi:signal transduction histidine kinase|nr:ATP-binding protein [Chthoniobacteraceae bacterium]
MTVEATAGVSPETLQIPFPRIAAFVRQVTHDVRNNLNSLDLQAAYATELITDPEAAAEVKRLRAIIQTSARQLQALSANFQSSTPHLIAYQASILIEDLRERLAKTFAETAGEVTWTVDLGREQVEVDVEMFFGALTELFRNAFQFRGNGAKIDVHVGTEEGQFVIELREPKPAPATPPEHWGEEPFVSSRRSGYGLGLFRVRRSVSAHGGNLTFSYDSARGVLEIRVTLPLATST